MKTYQAQKWSKRKYGEDLGELVSSDLSWKCNISDILSYCNWVDGAIKRFVGYHAPNKVVLNLYKSLPKSIAALV